MRRIAFATRVATSTGLLLSALSLAGCGGGSGGGSDDVTPPTPLSGSWVQERDSDGDGVVNDRSTGKLSFATDGSVATLESELDTGNDGIIDEKSILTFAHGMRASAKTSIDNDGDGAVDDVYLTSYTYTVAGYLKERISEVRNGGGALKSRRTERYSFDALGNLTSDAEEDDNNGDGSPEYRYGTTYTYDGRNMVASRQRTYAGTAPEPIHTSDTTCTYDGAGNKVGCVRSIDGNGDGVEDVSEVETNTYDAEGHQLTYLNERNNGFETSVQSYTYTYSAQGHRQTAFGYFDSNGDGNHDWEITYAYQYDAKGNEVATVAEWDDAGDGVVESRSGYFRTFDANGNLLSEMYKQGMNLDGSVYEAMTTETYAYDSNGIQLLTRSESDLDGNGTVDEVETHTIDRDPQERPVSKLSVFDNDNDGTPEATEKVTATWPDTVVPDAEFLHDYADWYY